MDKLLSEEEDDKIFLVPDRMQMFVIKEIDLIYDGKDIPVHLVSSTPNPHPLFPEKKVVVKFYPANETIDFLKNNQRLIQWGVLMMRGG